MQEEKLTIDIPVFYTVAYYPYDTPQNVGGLFCRVRRSYLGTFLRAKGGEQGTENGMPVTVRYRLSKYCFEWEKKAEKKVLQRAEREKYGYCLSTWNSEGVLISKARYNKKYMWLQTAYYSGGLQPAAVLSPREGGLTLLEYCEDTEKYRCTNLVPSPLNGSAAQQSLINTIVGEPRVVAETGAGRFCYCTPAQAESRSAVLHDLRAGTLSAEPEWPQAEEETAPFAVIDNTTPPQKPEELPLVPAEEVEDYLFSSPLEAAGAGEEAPAPQAQGDYAANRELSAFGGEEAPSKYSVAVCSLDGLVQAPQFIRVDGLAGKQALQELAQELPEEELPEEELPEEKFQEEPELISSEFLDGSLDFTGEILPFSTPQRAESCAAEALLFLESLPLEEAPKPNEPPTEAPPVEEMPEPNELPIEAPPVEEAPNEFVEETRGEEDAAELLRLLLVNDAAPAEKIIREPPPRPAKRIVISAQESYIYFGRIINGLREGRGRTQMSNGGTAYEGGYHGDRRDGFGVYYYKSGKLCYAGGWKQNKRDGMGVSYSSRDGSVFVGRWKNDIPTGTGAAFDAEGNLLYTGMWQGGVRHGRGTEYKNGEVVYSGEWENDCYNGYGTLTLQNGTTVSGLFHDGCLPPVQ